jgi:hypothetical protein
MTTYGYIRDPICDQHSWSKGQLHHICCGEFSMVVQYLSALDINALPFDLVAKKLDQLEAELEILLWVWVLHSDMKHSKY